MKNIYLLLVMVTLATTAQTKLAKYQKKIIATQQILMASEASQFVTVTQNNITTASQFSGPAFDPSKRTMYNLLEKGQKAYIEAVNSKTKDLPALLGALPGILEPVPPAGTPSPEIKKTEFSKKLEIIVNNKIPANKGRIAQLAVWLTLNNNDAIELSGFNHLTTKFQSIDFGSLSLSRTNGFTVNAGVNFGGTGAVTTTNELTDGGNKDTNVNGTTTSNASNLGISYNNSRTISENLALKSTIVSMKGSLSKKEVSLIQNGVPNQDLEDNINLDVTFKTVNNITLPYLKFKGLFDTNNAAVTDPTKIAINKGYITLPQTITTPVTATLSYAFVYRKIEKGENTAPEIDDKVKYYTLDDNSITTSPAFVLVGTTELVPKIYTIIFGNNPATDPKLYLNYHGRHVELVFNDLTAASELVDWLQTSAAVSIKGFQFELGTLSAGVISYANYNNANAGALVPVYLQ